MLRESLQADGLVLRILARAFWTVVVKGER
jgi:hypothetical protein